MKPLLFIIVSLSLYNTGFGQKTVLQDTTYRSWVTVDMGTLSGDGNYVYYRIRNEPRGSWTFVVKATTGSWEERLTSYRNINFSANGSLLFGMQKDTLFQFRLGTDEVNKINNCSFFKLLGDQKEEWLLYQSNDPAKTLIVKNLKNNRQETFTDVQQIITNKDAVQIVLKTDSNGASLLWVDLRSGRYKKIYNGNTPSNFIFDATGNQLAFTDIKDGITHIWHYDSKSDVLKDLASDHSNGILPDHAIETEQTWTFSADGTRLFFTQLKKQSEPVKIEGEPEIWNYKDAYLLSRYKILGKTAVHNGENLTMVKLTTGKITQLLTGNQRVLYSNSLPGDVLIIQSVIGDMAEGDYKNIKPSYYLCFVEKGEIRPLKINSGSPVDFHLSPNQQCVIYYDDTLQGFCSYQVKTGKSKVFCKDFTDFTWKDLANKEYTNHAEFAGWIFGSNHIILQGKQDLWEVDIDNNNPPRNLTKRITFESDVAFSIAQYYPNRVIPAREDIYLLGYNLKTKESGIYELNIGNNKSDLLHKGMLYFGQPYGLSNNFIKAKYVKKYLWKFESVAHSPNLFFSDESKKIVEISNINPEKNYNWINAELVNYKDNGGSACQAVIYKPENFDSAKRYPLIFFYYLTMTDRINKHLLPEPSNVGINIPLLVSAGYIVITPDIYKKLGEPGNGPLESVMAAADYMVEKNWIDSTKMALAGHSLGGYETNYIITHTNRFAAASVGAGISNMTQQYNDVWGDAGNSFQGYTKGIGFEYGLDSVPDRYIVNSPLFAAKNIQTPLLLMHNNADLTVPVLQSRQMFIQMRSLRKQVWLLQYDGEAHTIRNEANQLNYQKKIHSFFDYYLKNIPKPAWMNNPIK
jgi:dipeptidyl aminopeptidase/acylaminoacyl peptidase